MTATAAKAEKSLATTCAKYGITESGKRWLDLALDPFKDLNMPTSGYPDSVTVPSVVQTIHDSYTIAVPASVSAGNNWDCNIFIDQLYNSVNLLLSNTDDSQNAVYQAGQSSSSKRGGLIVRAGPANVNLDQTTVVLGQSLKQDILSQGDVRIIGMGLEIHNTTQELKKQGAIICYRVPDAPVEKRVINHLLDAAGSTCVSTSHEYLEMTVIPDTASKTIDLPGSIQWEAKDGAYIVPVLASPVNMPQTLKALPPKSGPYYPQLQQTGVGKVINFSIDVQNVMHGFSTSGCYLTGLSYETTLQVNLTYYVEVFPTISSVLRRSVQPAPGLDARALDLYAHIVAKLPVGVEVNDNFAGAFLSGIATIARTALPFIARNAGTIARGAEFLGGMFMQPRPNPMRETFVSTREDDRIEEINSPAIRREEERRVVLPSNGRVVSDTNRRGNEIVTQVRPAVVTRTVIRHDNNMQNNGPRASRTQKARKKKEDMITQASRGYAGNRWIDNPKKK